jgi:hypothetical protein
MDSFITWIVIALFYIPVHYLLPVLVVLMRSSDRQRRRAVRDTVIDCSLSMLLSFAVVIWLVSQERIGLAMAILLLSMSLPYIRILARGRAAPDPEGD